MQTPAPYVVRDDSVNANIQVPQIDNLGDEALELGLNEKYWAEGKALFDQFQTDFDKLKNEGSGGHLGVSAGYTVKTDTDDIWAIARYVVKTAGSSATTIRYDTIDKKIRCC